MLAIHLSHEHTHTTLDGPEIWFRNLHGRWSFLAETFGNYYRMMLTHLGIIAWQVRTSRVHPFVSQHVFSVARD